MLQIDDFPKNELEFHERFSTEEACREYWCKVRWPDGFVCPHCGHKGGWTLKGHEEIECANAACGKQTSPRAGTVLHNSVKPIRAWLLAMFHMSINKQGISALRLQRLLGFGSYDTALRWLRELRRVMAPTAASDKLGPEVEVDETFVGGVQPDTKGPYVGKKLVVGIVEKNGRGCGRARLRVIKRRDGATLCGFVKEFVEQGSIVCTDGYQGYVELAGMGFVHDPRTTTSGKGGNSSALKIEGGTKVVEIHLPRIHRLFSKFDRIVASAFQGNVSEEHIQGYLDEECFRFNRRTFKNPLKIFHAVVTRAVGTQCVPLWKSRGREAPYVPTKKATIEWKVMGSALQGCSYNG